MHNSRNREVNSDCYSRSPEFAPQRWNAENALFANNCYSYAVNCFFEDNFKTPPDPGVSSTGSPFTGETVDVQQLNTALCSDGLIPCIIAEARTDEHIIAVFLEQSGKDYHCLRRDASGYWSHKISHAGGVSNLDASGNSISDPEKADLLYGKGIGELRLAYKTLVGLFKVPAGGIQLSTGEERLSLPPRYHLGLGR